MRRTQQSTTQMKRPCKDQSYNVVQEILAEDMEYIVEESEPENEASEIHPMPHQMLTIMEKIVKRRQSILPAILSTEVLPLRNCSL